MLLLLTGLLFCLLIPFNAAAQQKVSGRVMDAKSNESLPGVNISVIGTTIGTSSDSEGNYSLTVPLLNDTLRFSFIGYKMKEVPLNGESTLNIELKPEAIEGEEMVVVGYGTQQKSDLTGSISGIKAKDIADIPTQSLQDALQGKISGVSVTPKSGRPGSQPVVRIRGVGTLNNASPLYVVDGMLIDDISFLNPQNVESVDVLKDASATAIYGSRGANGVIVITTKKGQKSGKTQVHVDSYYGIQRVNKKIDMVNARQFAMLANESAENEGRAPIFNDPKQYGKGFDWENWLINDRAPVQSDQISVSGGTEKVTFNVSGNFFQQKGVIRGSDFKRLSLRINNEYFITDNVTIGHNINFGYSDHREESTARGVTGLVNLTLQADPTTQPLNADGDFMDTSVNGGRINPAAAVAYNHNKFYGFRTTGNAYLDIDFLKNFNFRSSVGLDRDNNNSKIFVPEYFVTPIQNQQTSNLMVSEYGDTNFLNENTVNYKNEIGDHSINLLAGITFQDYTYKDIGGKRLNIPVNSAINPDPDLLFLNSGQSNGATNFNGSTSWGMVSYLFRANYNYKNTYLFTGTFRRDGSSRFARRNRWGNFPSVAAGWVLSNEAFMEDKVPVISYLKLRGSWGRIGNDKIDVGAAIPTVTSNLNVAFGEDQTINNGAAVTELANPDLKWEETEQYDIGLEIGLFDGQLNGDFDWYHRKTKDILIRVPIPSIVGIPVAPVVNAASVRNQGFEFNLSWKNNGDDFNYQIGVNGTTVSNEVLSLGQGRSEILAGGVRNLGATTRTVPGEPIGAFYGWKQDGIFQTQEEIDNSPTRGIEKPGDIKIADINNDGVIDDNDETYLGSPIPDFYFGMNLEAGYKNFDLSINIDGQVGNKILYSRTVERGFGTFNYESFFLDRWTGPGTSNTEPRITEAGHNYEVLDRFLRDGDFIRLRNIQLGYSFSTGLIDKLNIRSARFYLSGTNVVTLTGYPGSTPQIGGENVIANGIDNGTYPVASTFTLGLQLGL